VLKKLKSWINRESKPGMPLWRALLFERRLPYRYKNIFFNIFFGWKTKCSISYLKYKLVYHCRYSRLKKRGYKELRFGNTRFSIFIDKTGKLVIKIPYKPSLKWNYSFYKAIQDTKNYEKYYNSLMSLEKEVFLNKHICKVISISRDGGYTSPFIKGYNLLLLKNESKFNLSPRIKSKIISAINELIASLEKYQKKYGYILGDWFLSNLMYNINQNRIINVDLEGFGNVNSVDYHYIHSPYGLNDIKKDLNQLKLDLMKNSKIIK